MDPNQANLIPIYPLQMRKNQKITTSNTQRPIGLAFWRPSVTISHSRGWRPM
jgi:hypothetical protein